MSCEPCEGTGFVSCWSPGGPCERPNEPGCETCGPCHECSGLGYVRTSPTPGVIVCPSCHERGRP